MIPVPCPICSTNRGVICRTLRDHIGGAAFDAVRCESCDLVYLNPAPAPSELERYYSNESGHRMRTEPGRMFQAMQRLSFRKETRPLRRLLSAGDGILDVGAGDGAMCKFFKDEGYRSGAVDFYPEEEWPKARDCLPYKSLNLHGGNFTPQELIGVMGMSPKALVLRHVLEHLSNPRVALETIRMAGVKYVYIVVPNRDSLFARLFGDAWYYWDPPRHLTFFNNGSLAGMLKAAGFETVAFGHYGIDEIVTSAHRKLALNGCGGGALARLTAPKGLAAGIASALSSPLLDTVCWSVSCAK